MDATFQKVFCEEQKSQSSEQQNTQPLWDLESKSLENNILAKSRKIDCQESERNWQEN